MITKRLAAQVAVYFLGLLILAFGVVFAINSDLGISPVNALPRAASLSFGFGMGISVTVFFLLCLVLQMLLLRRDFKPIDLTQIVYSFVFGYFVDLAIWVKGSFTLPTYAGQLTMLAISLILISCGLSLYLEAKLIPMPAEGLVVAIVLKMKNTSFPRVKVVFDCVLVSLAMLMTIVFMGGIYGIREGTVISAVLIGKLMHFNRKFIVRALDKLGFYNLLKG